MVTFLPDAEPPDASVLLDDDAAVLADFVLLDVQLVSITPTETAATATRSRRQVPPYLLFIRSVTAISRVEVGVLVW
jgi:hypothetical protein